MWKYANVVPVNEKNIKKPERKLPSCFSFTNFRKNTRNNSYLILFAHIMYHMNYSTRINQVFAKETQQYIQQYTIFKSFDCNPPLDVRSVYLDILKAFDRVLYDGLIYKLPRCGVSGQIRFLI